MINRTVALVFLILAGCAPKSSELVAAPEPSLFAAGEFFIEEHRGPSLIDATTVIVANAARRDEYETLLAAVGGRLHKNTPPLGQIGLMVMTVDEYVAARGGAAGLKAELNGKLRGRKAYVRRYVSIARKK